MCWLRYLLLIDDEDEDGRAGAAEAGGPGRRTRLGLCLDGGLAAGRAGAPAKVAACRQDGKVIGQEVGRRAGGIHSILAMACYKIKPNSGPATDN